MMIDDNSDNRYTLHLTYSRLGLIVTKRVTKTARLIFFSALTRV